MRLSVTDIEARHIGASMIAARAFISLNIDGTYMNTGWLCALGGCALSLPIAFFIDRRRRNARAEGVIFRVFSLLACLLCAYQAAVTVGVIIDSASYSNLSIPPASVLVPIMLLVCLYVIFKNGRGLGNAAKILGVIFCVLFAAMLAANIGNLRRLWLTPVMGPGAAGLLEGSLNAAACTTGGMLIFLPAEQSSSKRGGCALTAITGSAAAALMCAYQGAMIPAQPPESTSRLYAIAALLANGRTSLAVQLPMNIIWFTANTVALFGYSFTAALYFSKVFGSDRTFLTASAALAAVCVFFVCGAGGEGMSLSGMFLPMTVLTLAAVISSREKGANTL